MKVGDAYIRDGEDSYIVITEIYDDFLRYKRIYLTINVMINGAIGLKYFNSSYVYNKKFTEEYIIKEIIE